MVSWSVNGVQTASLLDATEAKVLQQRDRLVNNNGLTGMQNTHTH